MNLTHPEPPPVKQSGPDIWPLVIKDMEERNAVGTEKYGTPLQAGNGRDPLVDAYQEALDLVVYLRQAIEERKKTMFSIQQKAKEIDVTSMFNDERVVDAMVDVAEQVAIDERIRPLWPECPLDQIYLSLDDWKEAMLAARDYKQGELSATAFRERLAILAGKVIRSMVNLEA